MQSKKWVHDECWCEFKELDDRGSCKDNYMWNPSACDCVSNKACKIDNYLDVRNFMQKTSIW